MRPSANGLGGEALVPPVPIVALDVPTLRDAEELVERLGSGPDFFKVGLQLFTREGPAVVKWLTSTSRRVFLDLKCYDIPNTVRGAAESAAALGVELVTVHAVGGDAMIRAAVDGAGGPGSATGVLVVTVLTSFDAEGYADAIGGGYHEPTHEAVLRYADRAAECGARGVVCSGAEVAAISTKHGSSLGTLVPGLRLTGAVTHDQARVVTPAEARSRGAAWVIVGRAVTQADNPAEAYAAIVDALAG